MAFPGIPEVADPIETLNGNFKLTEHDLGVRTGCQGIDLHFERTYSALNMTAGSLSPGWVHNYEQRLWAMGDYVVVQRPRGSYLAYKNVGGPIYAHVAGDSNILVKRDGGGWALVSRDRHIDLFDASGRLIAQQDPNGNLVWMTYETYSRNGQTGARLARVDAKGGRYLWFGYDYYRPNRLMLVGDNSGRKVRFVYDDPTPYNFVSAGRLVGVTDVTGVTASYTYSSTWLLASKTDGLGNRVFTNTYDDSARVIRQVNNTGLDLALSYSVITDTAQIMQRVGAEEATNLFAVLTTTATDKQGKQTIFTFGSDGLLRNIKEPNDAVTHYGNYTASRNARKVVDALGHVTQINYNNLNQPTMITNPLEQTAQYSYDVWGQVTSLRDPKGRTTTFAYDGPNLITITNPLSQTTQFAYGVQQGWNGVLSQISRSGALTTTLTYNNAGDVTSVADALGNATRLAYDSLGRPTAITDARGYTTTLTYDAADRLLMVRDPLANTQTFTYNSIGNLVGTRDPRGATTVMTYTNGLLLSAVQDVKGGVARVGYDYIGRPITITDQLNRAYLTSYDNVGQVVAETNPLGYTTRYGYDLLGNTVVITDANNHTTTLSYDTLARPITMRDAANGVTRYVYDAVGNLTTITDTLGLARSITYDALDRISTVADPMGHTSRVQYTPQGFIERILGSTNLATRYQYDVVGQVIAQIVNDRPGQLAANDINLTSHFDYDTTGNLTQTTDPRGATTAYSYDALGRMVSATDALTQTTRYKYDATDNLVTVTNARNAATTYSYNKAQELVGLTDPLSRTMSFAYDVIGNMSTLTSFAGQTTRYSYDAANQPTGINYPNTTPDVSFTYDPVGNIQAMVDGLGTTAYSYDLLDRLKTRARGGRTIGYTYDAGDRLRTLDYWGQGAVNYDYDNAGRLTELTPWGATPTEYTYRANGQLATQQRGNGVTTQYGYDQANRLVRLTHALNSQTLHDLQYERDANGNTTKVTDATGVTTFQYDQLNQLSDATYPGISGGADANSLLYGYDPVGNRLNQATTLPTDTLSWAYDLSDRTTTPGYTYDANGNLLSDGATTYSYNDANQLIETIADGIHTIYAYDGWGNLVRSSANGIMAQGIRTHSQASER